jgi:hypothetical protein
MQACLPTTSVCSILPWRQLRRILPACAALLITAIATSQEDIRFNRDIRPLLSDRCFHCHGPDKGNRKAKLRLDRADGPDGSYRIRNNSQAIKPGSIKESAIWYRLTTENADDMMPPANSHKKSLTTKEKSLIRQWIAQGAVYEDHWAFVAPTQPAAAPVANSSWSQQPIDRFVLRQLESQQLKPSPKADQRTLIRRLSFDLTGLPPTRDEIHEFLGDRSPDAYAKLVDRLLARPQYGEHMTKYWLDLVRFADTNGVHHDHYRGMTRYRDWVIRSLNTNLPYDQFLTDQLAGDLHNNPTDDQLTASGFNRLHMIIDRGTALPEESFARNVIDRVTAVGTAFMGLTVQCAVCHDHKYDPIKQKDFYQLFAFFNNLDGTPETGGRNGADFQRGLQPPYISFPTNKQAELLRSIASKTAGENAYTEILNGDATEAQDDGNLKAELEQNLKSIQNTLRNLRSEKNQVETGIAAAMVMKERTKIRPARIFIRGAYDNPGEIVERNTPEFLPPMEDTNAVKTRMDLAQWLVSGKHPLTARVFVNRLWQQFFGVGIVKTSEDFGTQGEAPSHPDLLDHLSTSFVTSQWNIKALVRQIVMSATYQQSSTATPDEFDRDPDNRLLARGSRFRMDSEMIRDQILTTSGLLNPAMYGNSVKPPQPPGIWKAVTLPSSFPRIYTADKGDNIYRRSLYTFWKRGMPPPQMSILNAPTRESCTARRERTNTPLQALLLMNEQEYLKAARHLASQALDRSALSSNARLIAIFETITSQSPDRYESQALLRSLKDLTTMYRDNPKLAKELCEGIELDDQKSAAELAAWTVLVSTIFNLDITKTRN